MVQWAAQVVVSEGLLVGCVDSVGGVGSEVAVAVVTALALAATGANLVAWVVLGRGKAAALEEIWVALEAEVDPGAVERVGS